MKNLFLGIFILFNLCTTAQVTLDWSNYPGGVSVATDDSMYVYTVTWDSNPAGDITLTKRDSSGSVLWNAAYDNTDNTRQEVATWVAYDGIGNLIVSGTIRSGFSSPVDAASVLMKFNTNGMLIWRKVYENAFDGSSTKKCLVDASGNIYVLGLGNGPSGVTIKVKKFDLLGDSVWTFHDTLGIGAPLNLKFTPDNGLLIVARGVTGNMNGFAKIDLNGNLLWSITGLSSYTSGDAAGDIFGNTYLINGEYVISNSGSIMQKISPAGTVLWTDTNTMTGTRVEVGTDNNPLVCGSPGSGSAGCAFMKYDSNGTMLWQNQDADGPSYALLMHAQFIMDAANAGYLAASTIFQMAVCKVYSDGTPAWTATAPGSNSSALEIGGDGNVYVVGGTTARFGQSVILSSPIFSKQQELKLSPNPTASSVLVQVGHNTGSMEVFIYDSYGRFLARKTLLTTETELDLSDLQSGVYFLKVDCGEAGSITKRILKL